jgi:soluble P-type ATPase
MEKYAVSDVVHLQKAELLEVRARLNELRSSNEKTAAVINGDIERLTLREAELQVALADQ